jgi:hypothetical protein
MLHVHFAVDVNKLSKCAVVVDHVEGTDVAIFFDIGDRENRGRFRVSRAVPDSSASGCAGATLVFRDFFAMTLSAMIIYGAALNVATNKRTSRGNTRTASAVCVRVD